MMRDIIKIKKLIEIDIKIKNNVKVYTEALEEYNKMWKDLTMKEKAAFIKVAINNGITDLGSIRSKYNSFAEGGLFSELEDRYLRDNKGNISLDDNGNPIIIKEISNKPTRQEEIIAERNRILAARNRNNNNNNNNIPNKSATEEISKVSHALNLIGNKMGESAKQQAQNADSAIASSIAYAQQKSKERVEDFYPYKLFMEAVPTALAVTSLGLTTKGIFKPLTLNERTVRTISDAAGANLDFIQSGVGLIDNNYTGAAFNASQGLVGSAGTLGDSDLLQLTGTRGRIADKALDILNVGSNLFEIGNNIYQFSK